MSRKRKRGPMKKQLLQDEVNLPCPEEPDPDDFNEGILLPSLILQLRSILERYPDDGQILKEIIQNAEDAGASKVIFLIDSSTYGTDVSKLHHKGLAKYQGPALYAYNDAVFRYADWKGIRMLDDSVKADNPLKIGRFGLGFKSVFHMTDLPSIFSGKGIGFIDPHKECFKYQPPGCRTKEKTTAFFWHLDKDHEHIARLKDQFEPYLQPMFGVTSETFQSTYFNGTVFRFPFRTGDMKSDLSKTTYDRDKVLELVRSLRANAHHMLLFLRKLQSVEVYEKTQDGRTLKLLEINIGKSYLKLIRGKRSELHRKMNVEWREQAPVSVQYPIAIHVEIWDVDTSVKETSVWLVSQYYAGVEESRCAILSNDKSHLPLVGVALPVETSTIQPLCNTQPKGHIFCFLPLPLEKKSPTGLRFHVHGNFAVEQNRRHIKWPSADRDESHLTDDALWNHFLVNTVLPKAALGVVDYLTQLRLSGDNFPAHFLGVLKKGLRQDAEFVGRLAYAVFPDVDLITPQWKELAEAFYREVWIRSFFHAPQGKWIGYRDGIFECIEAQDPLSNLIRTVLCEDKRNLVSIPKYIKDRLPCDAKYITPNLVVESLRNVQYRINLKDEERGKLLEYLLQFSKDPDRQKDLVGLALLPLEDGTWTEFELASSFKKVYIASKEHPLSLLPGLEGRFIKSKTLSKTIKQLVERGITQLKYLDSKDFVQMIGDVFSKWIKKETVALDNESWFSKRWLATLWKYLQEHFRTDLHPFDGLHILPLGNGCIAKLSPRLPIVSKIDVYDRDGEPLNGELVGLCKQVGVLFVEDLMPEVLEHSSVWNTYVLRPNACGVLTALERLEKQIGNLELVKLFKDVPDKSKDCFRGFIGHWISIGKPLTADVVNLLSTLPIFRTVGGSGQQAVTFVALIEEILVAPLTSEIPLPSPEVLLDASDQNSYLLARSLGVKPPNIPDHLINVYFPAVSRAYYDPSELMKLMQYVCNNLLTFEKINKNIVSIAAEISFVPKKNGNLVRPADVYENSDLLGKLFVRQDVFPCGEFAKDEFKVALLRLGLKTAEAVTPQEVVTVAKKLSGRSTHPKQIDLKQSEALMKFLEQHGRRVLPCMISKGRSLQVELTELKWVKISSVRPPLYPSKLAFVTENRENSFVHPREVLTYQNAYLTGSVRCTIDTSSFPSLTKYFSWTAQPQLRDVACHLLKTVANYDAHQKSEVLYVLNHVYNYFNEQINGSNSQEHNELQSVLFELQNQSWVWHGDGFARTSQMVLVDNHGIDMRPYVYTLPKEIENFLLLWKTCNIRKQCSPFEVLRAIKTAHDENDIVLKNKEHDLKLAVNILNEIANYPSADEQRHEIVIPVTTDNELLVMKSINECTYCDTEWYHQGFDVDDLEEKNFLIHELIPLATAEKLNIPSLISKTIGAEELDMEFGQSEPLTRRLRSLLNDYTDGLAVLKELIQNADDAGASEIRFLYDERSNEDSRKILLDQGMKDLQGPALWTYNDAVFTDDDFKNITKLSGATKEKVTQAIGRFGLGFNAVYNLTDVPMFISRQFIVIFDPQTTYLGRALPNKTKPGIRLNLDRHRNKIRRLTDQFKPMNGIFGCEMGSDSAMKSYEGTLFRFPLRTMEQAKRSEISNVYYNREEIQKLLKLLYDAGNLLLLYTQNVRKITVYHLPETSSPPGGIQEWFCIQKGHVRMLRSLTSASETECAVLKRTTAILDEYRVYPLTGIQQLDSSSVVKFTVHCGVEFPKNFQRSTSSDISEWLVVSSVGSGESLRMAIESEKRNIVPIGGAAARLERKPDGGYKVVNVDENGCGMLFCFLPLPINTYLPVHINGYFDIHSSRTHLYERSPQDKNVDSRALWNEALLDDAVTRAYCVLLEDLAMLCPEVESYALWPSKRESGLLGRLTESMYRNICSSSNDLKVVKTLDGWTTIVKSIMLNRQFRSLEIGEIALSALETILRSRRIDAHVVDLPDNITETILQTTSADVIRKRVVSKVDFYKSWFLPNIEVIAPLERDQFILHALLDKEIAWHLVDRNCIPVSPSGFSLKSIKELIHPVSRIALLFDAEDGRFPMWTSGVVVDSNVYEKLVELGMKKDDLSWQEILLRCKSISSKPDTAATRTPVILELVEKKLRIKQYDSSAAEAVFGQIRDVKFLPVLKKPKDFPLKWKGDDYWDNSLIACKEGYLEINQMLVGCSCPIVDEMIFAGNRCSATKLILGLENKAVDPALVVQQVLEVIAIVEREGGTVSRFSSESLNMLTEVYNASFNFLNYCLGQKLLNESAVKPLVLRKSVKVRSNYFMSPDRCAEGFLHGNDAMLPYLAVVPRELATSYPDLLKAIGVKETFSVSDYVRILKEIKDQVGNSCLDENKLRVVIHLITMCIYEEIKSCPGNLNRQIFDEMPIPNAEGRMCPARDLCFNNCVWLIHKTEKSKFCHDRISHEIASGIGLRTVRQDILRRHQLAVPFGQKERLVCRIKGILDGYPFSEDILKEMLQNADDAGAKEIHFILDTRTLPDKRVFENSWKALQGPALCVYNDRSFSESDLNGIQRLGEGGKSDDPTTTGQYGVGFNCVYHLTDVPTFLTTVENKGTVLCAFDPNCTFVPGASSADPGAMFSVDQKLKEQFVDVFKGYIFAHRQYDVSQTGTLFRLPLRNRDTAKVSEISKKPVTVSEVDVLFEKFESDLSESILFLNSIEKIQLAKITAGKGNTDQRKVLYEISVKMTEDARRKRTEFFKYVKSCAKAALTEIGMKEISYEMKISDSRGYEDVWLIVQRVGFEANVVPPDVVRAGQSGILGLLPRGGVAYLVQTTRTVKRQSRLFCFLPLPVQVQLPVHVNGHFALDRNRRNLWKTKHRDYKREWNTCLMEGVVSPAYCTALCAVRDRVRYMHSHEQPSLHLERYFEVFPQVFSNDDSYVNCMASCVYTHIISNNLEVLPLQSDVITVAEIEWKHPRGEVGRKIYFDVLDSDIRESSRKISGHETLIGFHTLSRPKIKSSAVRKLLVRCGFSLFWCPPNVREYFLGSGKDVLVVSPTAILDFFATNSDHGTRCKVLNLPRQINNTPYQDIESLVVLLEYCTHVAGYKDRLEGMPFVVTVDSVVSLFDGRMVKYVSIHSGIAPHIPDQFMNLEIKCALCLEPSFDFTLCKEFRVTEFAMTLTSLVRKPEFYSAETWFPISKLNESLMPYNTDSIHWLRKVWSFLASFLDETSEDQDKEVISELLKPLMNCCLLPVITSIGETLLYPLSLSSGVIAELGTNETCSEVVSLLYSLGVAKPDYRYIYEENKCPKIGRILKYSLGTVQEPATVVEALKIAMKHRLTDFKATVAEGLQLLEYLSVHINSWKCIPGAKATIAKLPFFLTFWNTSTSLDNSTVYVLPSEIPLSGIESSTAGSRVRFLKNVGILQPLLEHLDCQYLNIEKTYCSFLFERFQSLSQEAQLAHLDFVKQHVVSLWYMKGRENAELNSFLQCLKNLAFIPNKSNVLRSPSEFYDPQNEIFQVMHEDDRFPPVPYDKEDWLTFLRLCGLVSEITREKFLSYAQQVERGSQSCFSREVVKQSETLVKHFLNRTDHRQMDLEFLRNVRFVSPGIASKSLETLCVQYGTRDGNNMLRFIGFAGATLHENEDLVWTVQNLLPGWILRSGYPTDLLDSLQVTVSVQSTTVAEHVKRLCSALRKESLLSDPEKAQTLIRVLGKAFAFFKEKGVLEERVKNVLSSTCCIFVTDPPLDLIAPSQVAIDITTKDEIRPYLYKIPLDFGSYTSVLLQLGTTKVLTAKQYAYALKKIADASQGKKMHPEEKRASCRATAGLLGLLARGETVDGDIFLPCTDQKLHKSTQVTFIDEKRLLQRLKTFECPILIDEKDFNIKSGELKRILKKMPEPQRTRFLSQIVHEVIANGQPVKCNFAEKASTRLLNLEFRRGFECIVRHCLISEANSQITWNEENLKEKWKQLTNRLDSIQFIGRKQVQTYLRCDERKIEGSEQNLRYFIETSQNEGLAYWKFYIAPDSNRPEEERLLYHEFAGVLVAIAEQRITDKNLFALIAILDCPINKIQEMLNSYEIKESRPLDSSVLQLGSRIPQEYLHWLIQDNFLFYPGQRVAFEIDDPFDREEDGEPVYILVEIVEKLESDDPKTHALSAKYKVRVNHAEERTVNATLLYAFSRDTTEMNAQSLGIRVKVEKDSTPKSNENPKGSIPKPNENSEDNTSKSNENPKGKTLKEAVEEIKKILKEAWKGTLEERNRIRKRLYLTWHPDKNPDQIELCTEVCKILQHLIKLLEEGKSIDDYGVSDKSHSASSPSSGCRSDFDDYYSRAGQRARYFYRGSYSGNSYGQYSGGSYSSRHEFAGFRKKQNPQQEEGRRWMRQARHDLGAVANDRREFDWKCLKCFEAAKIALLAVQYATNSNFVPTNLDRMDSVLPSIGDVELSHLCRDLEHLVVSMRHMKYPISHNFPQIPGEVYRDSQANEAYRLSKQILDRCAQIIERS